MSLNRAEPGYSGQQQAIYEDFNDMNNNDPNNNVEFGEPLDASNQLPENNQLVNQMQPETSSNSDDDDEEIDPFRKATEDIQAELLGEAQTIRQVLTQYPLEEIYAYLEASIDVPFRVQHVMNIFLARGEKTPDVPSVMEHSNLNTNIKRPCVPELVDLESPPLKKEKPQSSGDFTNYKNLDESNEEEDDDLVQIIAEVPVHENNTISVEEVILDVPQNISAHDIEPALNTLCEMFPYMGRNNLRKMYCEIYPIEKDRTLDVLVVQMLDRQEVDVPFEEAYVDNVPGIPLQQLGPVPKEDFFLPQNNSLQPNLMNDLHRDSSTVPQTGSNGDSKSGSNNLLQFDPISQLKSDYKNMPQYGLNNASDTSNAPQPGCSSKSIPDTNNASQHSVKNKSKVSSKKISNVGFVIPARRNFCKKLKTCRKDNHKASPYKGPLPDPNRKLKAHLNRSPKFGCESKLKAGPSIASQPPYENEPKAGPSRASQPSYENEPKAGPSNEFQPDIYSEPTNGIYSAQDESEESDPELQAKITSLIEILPDIDPTYLEEKCKELQDNEEAFKGFLSDALENKKYPTRADYLRREKARKEIEKFTDRFDLEEFMQSYPEPKNYFLSKNHDNDLEYFDHSIAFLKEKFKFIHVTNIQKIFVKCINLTKAVEELKKCTLFRKKARSSWEIKKPAGQHLHFLLEMTYIQNAYEIDNYHKNKEESRRLLFEEAKKNGELLECGCCFDNECLNTEIATCPDGHIFCHQCIRTYSENEMGMGKTALPCLDGECNIEFTSQTLQEVLNPNAFLRLMQKRQQEEVNAAGIEGLESCPFCNFSTIPAPGDKVFKCLNEDCMKDSCRECKEASHIPLRCDEVEKSEELKARLMVEKRMTDALIRECPKCKKKFVKIDGCNKMVCTCGAISCYICRKMIKGYDHFKDKELGNRNVSACPLYSDNNELHINAVAEVAEKAKKELQEQNPGLQLKFDPTKGLPEPQPVRQGPPLNQRFGNMPRILHGINAHLDVLVNGFHRYRNLADGFYYHGRYVPNEQRQPQGAYQNRNFAYEALDQFNNRRANIIQQEHPQNNRMHYNIPVVREPVRIQEVPLVPLHQYNIPVNQGNFQMPMNIPVLNYLGNNQPFAQPLPLEQPNIAFQDYRQNQNN